MLNYATNCANATNNMTTPILKAAHSTCAIIVPIIMNKIKRKQAVSTTTMTVMIEREVNGGRMNKIIDEEKRSIEKGSVIIRLPNAYFARERSQNCVK